MKLQEERTRKQQELAEPSTGTHFDGRVDARHWLNDL